jgi:hypothetical protein
MGGRGGSGAGTNAWAFSPSIDMVTYLPWSSRFIPPASNLKQDFTFILPSVDIL